MKIEDIRRVLIIGAGTMGQQIGFVCAMSGYDVVFYDISDEILNKAMGRVKKLCAWFVQIGRLTQEQYDETIARISLSSDAQVAAREVDFVSESVPEDPELKARVFAQFNKRCPERTIFTTNTSMLVPSMIAEETGRPEKFAAFHFHDVRMTNVVDIMPHPGTSQETTDLINAFAKSIGQVVIMLHKENNGYVFNTMLSSLFFSALTLASNEVASVEAIDRAWMGVMHTPIGPFGIMDQVGLKTVWTITDYWAKKVEDPQAQANADFIKEYLDKGCQGARAMKGFYSYPEPVYAKPSFLQGDE
jgi:3-hydroxybutyryl-CoA dehydrogenase